MTITPQLAHVGIYVRDVAAMTHFYTTVFGLKLTDQGVGRTFKVPLHFLSGTSDQHHQLVLAGGRAADTPSTIMQLSFKVSVIDDLRRVRAAALAEGASKMRGMNHGNALSIYFADLEDNTHGLVPEHRRQRHHAEGLGVGAAHPAREHADPSLARLKLAEPQGLDGVPATLLRDRAENRICGHPDMVAPVGRQPPMALGFRVILHGNYQPFRMPIEQ